MANTASVPPPSVTQAGVPAALKPEIARSYSFVDLEVGGGSLATVYADRVGRMAQSAGIDDAELLAVASRLRRSAILPAE